MSVTKFTPENRGALIERTAAGVSLSDACSALGLRIGTVKGWLTRGRRDGEGPYANFAQAIDGARAGVAARPEPMDEKELRLRVSEAGRKGSVQALKLYWQILLEDRKRVGQQGPQADPLSVLDELAARRIRHR